MARVKNLLTITMGILLLTTASFYAQEPPLNDQGASSKTYFRDKIREIFDQLHLTDDQKKQLESNKQAHRACMQRCREELRKSKEEIRRELMKPKLDMPKIHQLHKNIKDLLSKMEDDKLNSILAVRAILTPDQFMKFIDLMHHNHPDHK